MRDSAPAPAELVLRRDLRIIADMIAPGSRVLDVGCGDGALLAHLVRHKNVDGRGLELSQHGVNVCVTHGLSVIQGNADTDLADYPSNAFDYAVLSDTLHATYDPKGVLLNLVRIGRNAVVSFENFGHWRIRLGFLLGGRMPTLGQNGHWYDSPNIHLCTFLDFAELCADIGLAIERAVRVDSHGRTRELRRVDRLANLSGGTGIFLLGPR